MCRSRQRGGWAWFPPYAGQPADRGGAYRTLYALQLPFSADGRMPTVCRHARTCATPAKTGRAHHPGVALPFNSIGRHDRRLPCRAV